jgi:hypothetical protein
VIRSIVIFLAYAHDLAETIREALGIVPPRRRDRFDGQESGV